MIHPSIQRLTLTTLALFLGTTNAIASEGAVEINQTCAVQTGCLPGDTPGFPITINFPPGIETVLTSDLVVPDANTTAIRIATNDVHIDLNQFAIRRTDCTTTVAACTLQIGTGSGIETLTSAFNGLRVSNGSIFGMGDDGIDGGRHGVVSGVRAYRNGDSGITITGRLSNNIAFENGGVGISGGGGSQVEGNVGRANGGIGINGGNSILVANTAALNTSSGLSGSAMMAANFSRANQGSGFSGGFGSTVADSCATANSGDGITGSLASHIRASVSSGNTGSGLNLLPDTSYRDNVIAANGVAAVTGGFNLGSNTCDGTSICP